MQLASNFSIKTKVFEGPLELLLDLVEKRKLLINDISLAEVTDEYMRQVSIMQELSLPNTAQFITLAATLLLVKSKSLLPVLELTEEEEASIEDLEERLRQYKLVKETAENLQVNFGSSVLYSPLFNPPATPIFVPDNFCTPDALHKAILDTINALPKKIEPNKASVKITITLEEMMDRLQARIRQNLKARFSEMHADEPERKVVIVGFLAILELFKQGNLIVTQPSRFSDIEIELDKGQTPSYY
ncbi:MAG: segregation/condensation protein A [Candidatus Paceibacterota bacterium]